jgi:hypothetical protein
MDAANENERNDADDNEVVVVGTVPQIHVVRSMTRKKMPVTSNLLYIREGGLRIRGRKLSYHNHNTLTLQSQSSPQMPIHQTHRPQQE